MDTTFVDPNIYGKQLQAAQAQAQFQDNQYNPQLLQQKAEQGALSLDQARLALMGMQQQLGVKNFLANQIMRSYGSGESPSVGSAENPSNQPSATGGGGSSGGSVGSNPSANTSPASTSQGTAAPVASNTPAGTAASGANSLGFNPNINFDPTKVAGLDPQVAGLAQLLDPEGIGKSIKETQESQQKAAQLQAQRPLQVIDSIIGAPNSPQVVMGNDGLLQRWRQLAPQFGLNPTDPTAMTPENIRQVFGNGWANQIRAQVGIASQAYYQTSQSPGGAVYQTRPDTGETKQITGENLKPVVGNDGKPVLVTADQAAGRQPFNASIFGAGNMSDNAIQFAADYGRDHGGQLPPGFSRNPMMASQVYDRMARDSAAAGDTMGSIVARNAANKADAGSLTQLQRQSDNVTAYGKTLDSNIALLQDAMKQRDSTGSPLINKALTAWQQGVTGDPATAKYVAALTAVQTEVAKIQSGALGNAPISDSLRGEINSMANKNMAPAQLQGALDTFVAEGKNRREAMQEQINAIQDRITARAPGGAQKPPASNPAGGAQTQASNSAPAQGGKVVTQAQVNDYAQKHGLTPQQALAHVQANGFTVQ